MENSDMLPEDEFFELSTSQTTPNKGRSGGYITNESEDKRNHRLSGFFAQPKLTLYSVGNLLASQYKGKSIAKWIEADNTFALPMKTIKIDGNVYPLREGFVLSIDTCRTPTNADGLVLELPPVWGCLCCGSAHGTGIAPSKGKPKASGLESNAFYYCPLTQDLFCVSASCWVKYFNADTYPSRRKSIKVAPKVAVTK